MEVFTGEGWELADPSWASHLPGFFKRLWFGRSDGSHLSYGETGQYQQNYAELTTWAEQTGKVVGAMSAPLHFVASAAVEGTAVRRTGCKPSCQSAGNQVQVEPSVTLRKGWDGRWVYTVGVYGLGIAVIGLLEKRLKVVVKRK